MDQTSTETAGGGQPGAGGAPADVGGQGSQPAQPWYSTAAGISDEDRAYIENKGWREGPQNILKSYRDLERVMGDKANAVLLPKPGDPNSTREFLQRHMGAPAEVDGYKPPEMGEGELHVNDASMSFIKQAAHAVGATQQQFEGFVKLYNEQIGQAKEADVTRFNGQVKQTKDKLAQEFGQEYGEQVARGNLAMRKLGIDPEELTGISEAIGVERATRLLMNIGGMLASDKSVGMDGKGTQASFVTDKAKAQDRIKNIRMGSDPNFQKALLDKGHPEHANVTAQWREWQRVANS